MPFALLIIGAIAGMSAIRGTHVQLGQQLVRDFTGPKNFTYWVVALIIIGSIGYIPQFQKFSRMFLFLCLLSFVILNPTVMVRIKEALDRGPIKPAGGVSSSAAPQQNAASQGATGSMLGNGIAGQLDQYLGNQAIGAVRGFLGF